MPTLKVPATLEHLNVVNEHIEGQTPERYATIVPKILLLAEEILVNVFSYAYPNIQGKAEVDCREVHFDGKPYFCLMVKDWGPAFDPFSQIPEPDISLDVASRPIGGLGVHLIRSMVAHYSYCRHEDTNITELYFEQSA